MAATNSSVAVPAQNGKNLDTVIVTTPNAGAVHRQAIVIADPETAERMSLVGGAIPVNVVNQGNGNGLTDPQLRAAPIATTNPTLDAKTPDLSGVWGYANGTAGTVALTGGKRPLQITAMAGAVNATLSVNGGGDIFIPALTQFTFEPRGNLVDPTIIFTNTQSYVVEFIV